MAYPNYRQKNNITDEGGDFSPTPAGYTHKALTKAIDALDTALSNNQTVPDAISHLVLRVDLLERVCRARKILSEHNEKKYEDEVMKYNPPAETNETIKKGIVANYKLQLLMELVFTTSEKDKEIIF